jgi:hypothetical protein
VINLPRILSSFWNFKNQADQRYFREKKMHRNSEKGKKRILEQNSGENEWNTTKF